MRAPVESFVSFTPSGLFQAPKYRPCPTRQVPRAQRPSIIQGKAQTAGRRVVPLPLLSDKLTSRSAHTEHETGTGRVGEATGTAPEFAKGQPRPPLLARVQPGRGELARYGQDRTVCSHLRGSQLSFLYQPHLPASQKCHFLLSFGHTVRQPAGILGVLRWWFY